MLHSLVQENVSVLFSPDSKFLNLLRIKSFWVLSEEWQIGRVFGESDDRKLSSGALSPSDLVSDRSQNAAELPQNGCITPLGELLRFTTSTL